MAEKWHSGINMHKLSVGAGFEGLLFAVGCALIFVFGLPALWVFLAFSAALGIGIAVLLQLTNSHRSERMKPLSIFSTAEKTKSPAPRERVRWRKIRKHRAQPLQALFRAQLALRSAFGGFLPPV